MSSSSVQVAQVSQANTAKIWTCGMCTYQNKAKNKVCDVCLQPRPKVSKQNSARASPEKNTSQTTIAIDKEKPGVLNDTTTASVGNPKELADISQIKHETVDTEIFDRISSISSGSSVNNDNTIAPTSGTNILHSAQKSDESKKYQTEEEMPELFQINPENSKPHISELTTLAATDSHSLTSSESPVTDSAPWDGEKSFESIPKEGFDGVAVAVMEVEESAPASTMKNDDNEIASTDRDSLTRRKDATESADVDASDHMKTTVEGTPVKGIETAPVGSEVSTTEKTEAEKHLLTKQWLCQQCTYMNHIRFNKCDVCTTKRPSHIDALVTARNKAERELAAIRKAETAKIAEEQAQKAAIRKAKELERKLLFSAAKTELEVHSPRLQQLSQKPAQQTPSTQITASQHNEPANPMQTMPNFVVSSKDSSRLDMRYKVNRIHAGLVNASSDTAAGPKSPRKAAYGANGGTNTLSGASRPRLWAKPTADFQSQSRAQSSGGAGGGRRQSAGRNLQSASISDHSDTASVVSESTESRDFGSESRDLDNFVVPTARGRGRPTGGTSQGGGKSSQNGNLSATKTPKPKREIWKCEICTLTNSKTDKRCNTCGHFNANYVPPAPIHYSISDSQLLSLTNRKRKSIDGTEPVGGGSEDRGGDGTLDESNIQHAKRNTRACNDNVLFEPDSLDLIYQYSRKRLYSTEDSGGSGIMGGSGRKKERIRVYKSDDSTLVYESKGTRVGSLYQVDLETLPEPSNRHFSTFRRMAVDESSGVENEVKLESQQTLTDAQVATTTATTVDVKEHKYNQDNEWYSVLWMAKDSLEIPANGTAATRLSASATGSGRIEKCPRAQQRQQKESFVDPYACQASRNSSQSALGPSEFVDSLDLFNPQDEDNHTMELEFDHKLQEQQEELIGGVTTVVAGTPSPTLPFAGSEQHQTAAHFEPLFTPTDTKSTSSSAKATPKRTTAKLLDNSTPIAAFFREQSVPLDFLAKLETVCVVSTFDENTAAVVEKGDQSEGVANQCTETTILDKYLSNYPNKQVLALNTLYKCDYNIDVAHKEMQRKLAENKGNKGSKHTTVEPPLVLPSSTEHNNADSDLSLSSQVVYNSGRSAVLPESDIDIPKLSPEDRVEFVAAMSRFWDNWREVKVALNHKYTISQLQGYYHCIWCTRYCAERNAAERRYKNYVRQCERERIAALGPTTSTVDATTIRTEVSDVLATVMDTVPSVEESGSGMAVEDLTSEGADVGDESGAFCRPGMLLSSISCGLEEGQQRQDEVETSGQFNEKLASVDTNQQPQDHPQSVSTTTTSAFLNQNTTATLDSTATATVAVKQDMQVDAADFSVLSGNTTQQQRQPEQQIEQSTAQAEQQSPAQPQAQRTEAQQQEQLSEEFYCDEDIDGVSYVDDDDANDYEGHDDCGNGDSLTDQHETMVVYDVPTESDDSVTIEEEENEDDQQSVAAPVMDGNESASVAEPDKVVASDVDISAASAGAGGGADAAEVKPDKSTTTTAATAVDTDAADDATIAVGMADNKAVTSKMSAAPAVGHYYENDSDIVDYDEDEELEL